MGHTAENAMMFEDIKPMAKVSKGARNKAADQVLAQFSFGQVLWYEIKTHKFGLALSWAILMTVSWAVPSWPDMVASVFGLLTR